MTSRNSAFFGCSDLSEGLKVIDEATFPQCPNLFTIAFKLSAETIDKLAFSDTKLGYVVFPFDTKAPSEYPWGNIHKQMVDETFTIV